MLGVGTVVMGDPWGCGAMESSRGLWGFMEGGCQREKDTI